MSGSKSFTVVHQGETRQSWYIVEDGEISVFGAHGSAKERLGRRKPENAARAMLIGILEGKA